MVPWCIFEGKELNLKAKLAILITSRGHSFWDISIFYYNTEVLSLWPREEKWSLEMATHSSVLAWRIPGTGEPGGLPSRGSHRVRHDWSDLAAAAAAAAAVKCDYILHEKIARAWKPFVGSDLRKECWVQQNFTSWINICKSIRYCCSGCLRLVAEHFCDKLCQAVKL